MISSKEKHSPPKRTHSNARFFQTVYAGPVCIQSIQRLQKKYKTSSVYDCTVEDVE